MLKKLALVAIGGLLLMSCGSEEVSAPAPVIVETETGPLGLITDAELHRHISVLASDEFEGRLPGTRGEELTLAYLTEQFSAVGVQPGNNGSFLQPVQLASITSNPAIELRVEGPDRLFTYSYGDQIMAGTTRMSPQTALEASELITQVWMFAGKPWSCW
jgi:hypothetical protein